MEKMTTTPAVADLDSVDIDHGDVNRFRTLDLLSNFIGSDPSSWALGNVTDDGLYGLHVDIGDVDDFRTLDLLSNFIGADSSSSALGNVSDDRLYGLHVDNGDIDVSCELSLEVNSSVGSSGFHSLAQTENFPEDCGPLDGLRKGPLTTSARNSIDGSSGFGSSDFGIDTNAPEVSCELSLSLPGMSPNRGPSSSQSCVQNSQSGFEAMPRTTRLGKRPNPEPPVTGDTEGFDPLQGPNPEPPVTRTSKNKFFKSRQPHFDPPPYVLPEVFMQHILSLGGQEVKLVTQKVLTCSDLKAHLARLLLPVNQFVRGEHFLKPSEIEHLRAGKDNKIDVGVVSTRFKETALKFKEWPMGKNRTATSQHEATTYYVIMGGWIGFARENNLKENDRVQLWSFRVVDNRDQREFLKIAIVNLDYAIEDLRRE